MNFWRQGDLGNKRLGHNADALLNIGWTLSICLRDPSQSSHLVVHASRPVATQFEALGPARADAWAKATRHVAWHDRVRAIA